MKPGIILTIVLGLFVASSIAYMVHGELNNAEPSTEVQQPEASERDEVEANADSRSVVKAYYFHRTQRCTTCLEIESGAKHAIQEHFAGEIADRRLVWKLCNLDEPVNQHFVEDFDLSFSSLVLVEEQAGKTLRWKNLEKVWDLVHVPEELKLYVVDETRRFLDAG